MQSFAEEMLNKINVFGVTNLKHSHIPWACKTVHYELKTLETTTLYYEDHDLVTSGLFVKLKKGREDEEKHSYYSHAKINLRKMTQQS